MHPCQSSEAISLPALASSGFSSPPLKYFPLSELPGHSLGSLDSPLQPVTRNTLPRTAHAILLCPALPSSIPPDSTTPPQMLHLLVAHEVSPATTWQVPQRAVSQSHSVSRTHPHPDVFPICSTTVALGCSWCAHLAHHSSCPGVPQERTPPGCVETLHIPFFRHLAAD